MSDTESPLFWSDPYSLKWRWMGLKGVFTLVGVGLVLFPLAAVGDRGVRPHWPSIAIASLFCLAATLAIVLFQSVTEDWRRAGIRQSEVHGRGDRFTERQRPVVTDYLATLNVICVFGLFGYFMILWAMGLLG